MAKKEKKIGFIERYLTKLDNWMFEKSSTSFKSKLYKIMSIGIIGGIGLGVVAFICSLCGISEAALQWIGGVYLIAVIAYAAYVLLDNIKSIDDILITILYVVVNYFALSAALAIGAYLLVLACMLLVGYVVLCMMTGGSGSSSGDSDIMGRKHVATLDNGVKIYKGKDATFNSYYRGSDGNSYDTDDNGRTFYII